MEGLHNFIKKTNIDTNLNNIIDYYDKTVSLNKKYPILLQLKFIFGSINSILIRQCTFLGMLAVVHGQFMDIFDDQTLLLYNNKALLI